MYDKSLLLPQRLKMLAVLPIVKLSVLTLTLYFFS
jgi:hypothetical protein